MDGSIVVGWSKLRGGAKHAFAYDLAANRPRMLDLGSLGGASEAVGVSGTHVVGNWNTNTENDDFRAFVYDLAADEPAMVDLGTLGGGYAQVGEVSGTIITGYSQTATGDQHAFAYDLAADEPAMVDLGTLGGEYSYATGSHGTIVTGSSDTEDPGVAFRAFAYDLAASEPEMIDLGTLGGTWSTATGVDGRIIIGYSATATPGVERAFAYDLDADEPAMRGLGTLGGDGDTWAQDIDGTTVVGFSDTPTGETHPFSVDLAEDEPVMRDLGTMRGSATTSAEATAIDGDLVIGDWQDPRRNNSIQYSFAYDLGSANPVMYDLSTWRRTIVHDVAGDVVVGKQYRGSNERATAWVLRETTRPMFAFTRVDQPAVGERAGRVKIRVTRYGRLNRAVSVRYRTRNDSATAGQDFVAASGRLRFPKGVTRRSFTVKIKNDRVREYHEYLVLSLFGPSKPAVLGTPSWSLLRIRPNDR